MQDVINAVQASYDEGIERGPQAINAYSDPPDHIANDPDYQTYKSALKESSIQGNNREIISGFLKPSSGHRFVDLGCGLNLMSRGYDKWPSEYHGIDVSTKTIRLVKRYASEKALGVGALLCGSIHATPFQSNFFDIGECIGVVEYYEERFVSAAIAKMYRILKPNGKMVLDIPNLGHPACRIMMEIEECMDIDLLKSKSRWSKVAKKSSSFVHEAGFSIVEELVGHAIGKQLWEFPQVPNHFPDPRNDFKIKVGMVLAIEPMINMGKKGVLLRDDGWTYVTADNLPSAHFEHTVAITDKGPEVLTCGPNGEGWAM